MKKEQKNTSMQKEIDHRIKNNLNIVSSILGLQISSLQNGSIYNTTDILKKVNCELMHLQWYMMLPIKVKT